MTKIGVVGAGLMGRAIAACCANGGSDVLLFDAAVGQADEGAVAASKLNAMLQSEGIGRPGGRVRPAASLADAVREADIVFEAVVENKEVKQKVFRQVEQAAPAEALLCTNTSSLSVTAIAEALETPQRFLAAHFIGPAHLVPLVEVCPAPQTLGPPVQRLMNYLKHIGKRPVLLKKEIQGFLAARLQAALYQECMHLLRSGVASPEAIDGAVTDGFGRRLNQIGPFAVVDFAGVDLVQKTHATFFPQLGRYQRDLRCDELMRGGHKGVKAGSGNYRWSAEKAAAVAERRDAELLRRLKEDKRNSKL